MIIITIWLFYINVNIFYKTPTLFFYFIIVSSVMLVISKENFSIFNIDFFFIYLFFICWFILRVGFNKMYYLINTKFHTIEFTYTNGIKKIANISMRIEKIQFFQIYTLGLYNLCLTSTIFDYVIKELYFQWFSKFFSMENWTESLAQ